MKPIPFFLCTFSILFTTHAESPRSHDDSTPASLTLHAVTDAVLNGNPAIKEARAKWQAMKQRVPQAAAWDDLKVGGTTRLGRFVDVAANSFTDQMVSVEQMIPVSGKNRSRERIAAAEALVAMEELRRTELDAVARARAAFLRLGRDYALLELNRANESSIAQTIEISRARLEVGNQGQADVLVAENEANRLEETRHDLLQNISEDGTQLQVLMDRDPFHPLGKPADASWDGPEHFAESRLRAALLQNRPEVRVAGANVAAAEARLELARREWVPDPAVSIQAQRYNGSSQAISEVAAGVSFNVPWLNGRKYRAEEREAEQGIEAARQALEGARSTALGLLRDQLRKIETLRHHVDLFQTRLIPNARQVVQINRADYESGRTGFLDLVLSERSLRELEAMAQQHLANYRIALVDLEALAGAHTSGGAKNPAAAKGGAR
jgi:outer membrane protein TolC